VGFFCFFFFFSPFFFFFFFFINLFFFFSKKKTKKKKKKKEVKKAQSTKQRANRYKEWIQLPLHLQRQSQLLLRNRARPRQRDRFPVCLAVLLGKPANGRDSGTSQGHVAVGSRRQHDRECGRSGATATEFPGRKGIVLLLNKMCCQEWIFCFLKKRRVLSMIYTGGARSLCFSIDKRECVKVTL